MPDRKFERLSSAPWQVPVVVADIREDGQSFMLEADVETRAAIAEAAGLRDLPQLVARFDVTRQDGDGIHVLGHVSAMAGQTCVVTLEPLLSPIEENVDLLFVPQSELAGPLADPTQESAHAPTGPKWNDPEPLVGGIIDLGALATEFLILGLDPYPRKPGAVFEPPHERASDGGPFATLAGWAKGQNGR